MTKNSDKPVILPGLKPVLELLTSNSGQILKILTRKDWYGKENQRILELCEANHIPVESVEPSRLDALCNSTYGLAHQGIVALIKPPPEYGPETLKELVEKSPLPLVLALDQIQDAGNLGTIARTAYALGCAALILPEHNSAKIGVGALKASAGAINLLPIITVVNLGRTLDLAEEMGFGINAALCCPESENAFEFTWTSPSILVLGNENKGIRPGVLKRCNKFLCIPFKRMFDSLNISQAGAIFMGLFAAWHLKSNTSK